MTDWWTHRVADLADRFPGGVYGLGLAVLLLGLLVGVALQPAGFLRRNRDRRPRRRVDAPPDEVLIDEPDDARLPDLPSMTLRDRALRFTAAGDHRRAVREWLRAMVRLLVEQDVVTEVPGWTASELAARAGRALPAVAPAVTEAADCFALIWYGGQDADAAATTRMRRLYDMVAGTATGSRNTGEGTSSP